MKMEKAYLINNTHSDYLGLKWVLKAIKKDDTRYMLNRLSIDKTDAVCTDGHRLHDYYLKETFEAGLYKPFCVKNEIILIQSNDGEYPKWKQLFLETSAEKSIKIYPNKNLKLLNTSYAKLIRLMDEDEGLDLSYWNDILSFGTEYEVRWYGDKKQIIFINQTHRAMIMPMRV